MVAGYVPSQSASEIMLITTTTWPSFLVCTTGKNETLFVHAYLESVLRLCLLFLEGFRGNELGMMGVGVQGRLLQARRMQGGEGGLRERKDKQNDDMTWHVGRRERRQYVDPGREWLFMHMQDCPHYHKNQCLTTSNWQLRTDNCIQWLC